MNMMNTTYIGDARRAADKRVNALYTIFAFGIIAASLIVTSNADFKDETAREQAVADLACQSAGASAAVRVESRGTSVFVCDQPSNKLARRAS